MSDRKQAIIKKLCDTGYGVYYIDDNPSLSIEPATGRFAFDVNTDTLEVWATDVDADFDVKINDKQNIDDTNEAAEVICGVLAKGVSLADSK